MYIMPPIFVTHIFLSSSTPISILNISWKVTYNLCIYADLSSDKWAFPDFVWLG